MNIENVPLIRFELENIRHQIKSHLGTAGSELGEMIDKSIQNAISDYDFDGKVIKITHEIITEEIENFFKHDPGRDVVKATIAETLNKAFNPYHESNVPDFD